MTNNQDKMLAVVCVVLLVLSMGYFYLTTSPGEETESDVILSATKDYTSGDTKRYITAETLQGYLEDDNTSNDPYILSIRSTVHYALGHIPDAVNIAPRYDVFTEENLKDLPNDKQIVVYCYTGHTAAQTTALLNVNGYDALCLKWGMCSWTDDSTVAVGKYFTGGSDYPVVSGSDPGAVEFVVTGDSPQASVYTIPAKKESLTPLGCGDTAPPPTSGTSTTETSDSDAETLRESSYTALGKTPIIKAGDLWELLYNDTITSNDPFILDLRVQQEDKPDYYTEGHIAGAVNIGLGRLFTEEGLAKLPEDKNKQIVVVCYTGHTASQATALLNLNGYNATALMWGMCSWTTDTNVTGSYCFNKATDCHNYTFKTGAYDEEMRETFYSSVDTGVELSSDLYDELNDGDTTDDPFILSIRKSDVYELGHIPGAENIPMGSLLTKENLSKLPFDKEIIVVCYTGHTASQVTALLNALGYDATALKWGMCGWCANTTIAPKGFTRTTPNYPICTGSEPGTMDEAEEATIG